MQPAFYLEELLYVKVFAGSSSQNRSHRTTHSLYWFLYNFPFRTYNCYGMGIRSKRRYRDGSKPYWKQDKSSKRKQKDDAGRFSCTAMSTTHISVFERGVKPPKLLYLWQTEK